MAGRTGEADPLALPVLLRRPIELADGKAHRQATRVRCARQISQKAEPLEVIGGSEEFVTRGLL